MVKWLLVDDGILVVALSEETGEEREWWTGQGLAWVSLE